MIVETFIPPLAFSSQISSIVLSEATENVQFIISYEKENNIYEEVFTELFIPDSKKRVSIDGINTILNNILRENPVQNFKFTFATSESTTAIVSRILLSNAEIDADAKSLLHQRFVSLLLGSKDVYPNSLEYVYVYPLVVERWSVSATYRNNESGIYEYKVFTGVELPIDKISAIDVSPNNYKWTGKTLVSYKVICGNRNRVFFVDNLSRQNQLQIVFTNNFGLPETYVTQGTLFRENIYNNQFGKIRGEYNKYQVLVDKEYTANTGIMKQHTADWIEDDLFLSLSVFEIRNGKVWKKITITDAVVKRNNDKAELPSYEFKYRFSQRNQTIVEFAKYLYRVFAKTFSKQFN